MKRLNIDNVEQQASRLNFFDATACSSHTWPILGCEACHHSVHTKLEAVAYDEFVNKSNLEERITDMIERYTVRLKSLRGHKRTASYGYEDAYDDLIKENNRIVRDLTRLLKRQ